jgi:hypothetical protein
MTTKITSIPGQVKISVEKTMVQGDNKTVVTSVYEKDSYLRVLNVTLKRVEEQLIELNKQKAELEAEIAEVENLDK